MFQMIVKTAKESCIFFNLLSRDGLQASHERALDAANPAGSGPLELSYCDPLRFYTLCYSAELVI